MFNFIQYLKHLTEINKLAKKHKFAFGSCSGPKALQDALARLRMSSAFIIADTVTTGGTIKKGGSWYQRRTFTFFVIARAKLGDEANREKTLDICREIRRQFLSRILYDQIVFTSGDAKAELSFKESNVSFDLTSVQSTEYEDMRLDNCTGLYVMINSDEPISLAYEAREWD